MSSLRKNVGQSNPTRESWPIIFDVAQELFTVCYKWASRRHCRASALATLLGGGVCCASLEWASQSRRSSRSVSVWTESVTLSKPSRSLFAFRFGGLRQRNGESECELPWWQPSIVNRKETLNEELVAEDETETSWWVWSCDKCVVWFDFFFFTVPSFDFWARILCVN